jgi:hypothetical protein
MGVRCGVTTNLFEIAGVGVESEEQEKVLRYFQFTDVVLISPILRVGNEDTLIRSFGHFFLTWSQKLLGKYT